MFCGFLVFWCKRVLAVEEVVNARYGVIEQWALLLRNAWPKCFGQSPLPAYEPAFDWENERSMIFGQRTPETPVVHHGSGLKISVKVLPLAFQPGIVEPFYGTICLYNRERREKLSEDFYFSILPTEMQDTNKVFSEPRGLFYLDAPSASVCLLIQLEKPATEEGGVTPSVYSCKEPDPKRKVHKPVEGVLRLEIEKHQTSNAELENISESASMTNESMDLGDQVTDAMFIKSPNNGSDGPQSSNSKWNPNDEKNASGNGNTHGNPDLNVGDVSRMPFLCLYLLFIFLLHFSCLFAWLIGNNQGIFLVFRKYGLPIS
ncbi:hypothetical protein SLA2020_126800 [Shorea laevis]